MKFSARKIKTWLQTSAVATVLSAIPSVGAVGAPAHANPVVASEFIYLKAPFRSCHASTLVETSSNLVAAWFGGTAERNPDVCIYVSRLENHAWSTPLKVADGVGFTTNRQPCWNPVLFQPQHGPLLLFYKVGPKPSAWWGMWTTSPDNGLTWTKPERLPDSVLGPIKDKPIQLSDGVIVSGSSTENGGRHVHFELSTDNGVTWSCTPPVEGSGDLGAIQPTLLTLANGHLEALARTDKGRIGVTFSSDEGRTWSAMKPTDLPNPDSGIDAVTLADGRQLLVYNHNVRSGSLNKGRSPLNVALSRDGIHWMAALVLENNPKAPSGFSYPAVIQTRDGLVHITYTWERRRIRHVVLDPALLNPLPMADGKWPG